MTVVIDVPPIDPPPIVIDFENAMREFEAMVDQTVRQVGQAIDTIVRWALSLPGVIGAALVTAAQELTERFGNLINLLHQTMVTYRDHPLRLWEVAQEWDLFREVLGEARSDLGNDFLKTADRWSGQAALDYLAAADAKREQLQAFAEACAVGDPLRAVAMATSEVWAALIAYAAAVIAEFIAFVALPISGIGIPEALVELGAMVLTISSALVRFQGSMEGAWREFESASVAIAEGIGREWPPVKTWQFDDLKGDGWQMRPKGSQPPAGKH
ncbi:MAG TPA: hypothetical protein VFC19_15445 [Candidatus Limnocylindrales bacterium]|nr:hypothetical protein [Candidatus Limnocylindrales bacterium]